MGLDKMRSQLIDAKAEMRPSKFNLRKLNLRANVMFERGSCVSNPRDGGVVSVNLDIRGCVLRRKRSRRRAIDKSYLKYGELDVNQMICLQTNVLWWVEGENIYCGKQQEFSCMVPIQAR